ncbi:MAG: hypothetical protein Q8O72_17535 [Bacteroidales bacterium]|nr:hypothetical protein [Bacteroidales bacterium]
MKNQLFALVLILMTCSLQAQTTTTTCITPKIQTAENYYSGVKARKIGSTITIVGALTGGLGLLLLERNDTRATSIHNNQDQVYGGAALFVIGGIMTNIGIPIWIMGSVKAASNKDAVAREVRVRLNENGVGLVYHF